MDNRNDVNMQDDSNAGAAANNANVPRWLEKTARLEYRLSFC